MNKKNYKMKIFFSFALFFIFILNLLIVYQPTYAQDYKLGVPIGDTSSINFNQTTKPIATYISAIYKYAIGVVGILATIVLMYGGVRWIIAGGNAEAISSAKSWIAAALTGLVLILTSYMILYTINSNLVNLKTSKLKSLSTLTKCCGSNGSLIVDSDCPSGYEKFNPAEQNCIKSDAGNYTVINGVWCLFTELGTKKCEILKTNDCHDRGKICLNGCEYISDPLEGNYWDCK